VADGLRALIGTAPEAPLVYLLAALEVVWLASAAAVLLALVGLALWPDGSLAGRAAAGACRLVAAGRRGSPPAAQAAPAQPERALHPAFEPSPQRQRLGRQRQPG
jgi:hypothetical protein